jgi:multidrug resistance efflux pump
MARHVDVVTLVAGAAMVIGMACSPGPPSAQSGSVLRTVRAKFENRLVLTGKLESLNSTEIRVPRTPIWAVQISWMIEDGTEVEAGRRILEFDNSAFSGSIDEKRSALDRAVRNLEQERATAEVTLIGTRLRLDQARIARDEARLTAEVPRELIGAKAFEDSQIALRRTEVAYDKAAAALDVAQQTTETGIRLREVERNRARRQVTIAENAMDDLVITAPETGVVTVADNPREGRKFKIGDNPWAGLTVLRMPKLDRMVVRAQLFDVDDGLVTPGAHVQCRLDTFPDTVYEGVIRDIAPIAGEVGPFSLRRAFELTIDLEGSDPVRMRPGMSVRIDVPLTTTEATLIAPRETLDITDGKARIHLMDGSWRTVQLGPCSARFCVIDAGVDEDVVLASARANLQ